MHCLDPLTLSLEICWIWYWHTFWIRWQWENLLRKFFFQAGGSFKLCSLQYFLSSLLFLPSGLTKRERWDSSFSLLHMGHSCKIGNVPIVEAENIFFMFPVFWWYFWYQFVFTKMEKVKGQLKNISGEFFGQDLRFLCPHVTLPF